MKSFLMKGEYELWHDEENNISEVLCLRPWKTLPKLMKTKVTKDEEKVWFVSLAFTWKRNLLVGSVAVLPNHQKSNIET